MIITKTAQKLVTAKSLILTWIFLFGFMVHTYSATENFTSGSFIVNMGIVPQTTANGIKPYGMVYDLMKNYGVPIKWVISQTKAKDGIDFTYNSIDYKGGTFIIPQEFRSSAVNSRITYWQGQGVQGVTTSTVLTVNVTQTLTSAPFWAMDLDNGRIAIQFLTAAGIPSSAYAYRTPANLTACDDLFIMPHADPTWATHGNLFAWNLTSKGGIWAGCHAVSVMESSVCQNPSNSSQNLNFLSTNRLVNYGSHADGSLPYTHTFVNDPVFQYMGISDGAHTNGSEQIFMPVKTTSAWRASTKIGTYDPSQTNVPTLSDGPAAINMYGRGMGDNNRGLVMYQAGHDISGTSSVNIAAMRMFFNWSFLACMEKAPIITYSNIPANLVNGTLYSNMTCTAISAVSSGTYTYQWFSSVTGTFSAPTSAVTNFTPTVTSSLPAFVYCRVTDGCGRITINPLSITVAPNNAPLANWDAKATFKNTAVSGNTSTNDTDPDGNINTSGFSLVNSPAHGTLVFNTNGTYTYTPALNYTGSDNFVYRMCDLGLPVYCDTAIVYLTVYSPPVAHDDNVSTFINVPVNLNAVANDVAGSSPLVPSSLVLNPATAPNAGTVGVFTNNNNGTVTFTPATGYTGSASIMYSISDQLNQTTSAYLYVQINPLPIADTDQDGVPDDYDDYPTDPHRAFNRYYPLTGYSTLMYEDLWPDKGDYDFNDLVLDYRYNTVTNAANNVVEIKYTFVIKAIGAGLHNGFGFQLDNIAPGKITSVSGTKTHDVSWLSNAANGTENGQTYANIVVFSDVFQELKWPGTGNMVNVWLSGAEANPYVTPDTTNITVTLLNNGVAPLAGALSIGSFPPSAFNPYLIIGDSGSWNQNRAKEIHLPNRVPTSKVSSVFWGKGDDNSNPGANRYYKTSNNLPWAIDIYYSIPHMQEKRDIISGYLYFLNWASSNGTSNQDWYQNLSGYRNNSNLYIR